MVRAGRQVRRVFNEDDIPAGDDGARDFEAEAVDRGE